MKLKPMSSENISRVSVPRGVSPFFAEADRASRTGGWIIKHTDLLIECCTLEECFTAEVIAVHERMSRIRSRM
jgi:hypothetical protein